MSGVTKTFESTPGQLTRAQINEMVNAAIAEAETHFVTGHLATERSALQVHTSAVWNIADTEWPGGNNRPWFGILEMDYSVCAGRSGCLRVKLFLDNGH